MAPIADLHAREILDSRSNATVEAELRLGSGAVGWAAVPRALRPARTRQSNCAMPNRSAYQG
jgi:enolase